MDNRETDDTRFYECDPDEPDQVGSPPKMREVGLMNGQANRKRRSFVVSPPSIGKKNKAEESVFYDCAEDEDDGEFVDAVS